MSSAVRTLASVLKQPHIPACVSASLAGRCVVSGPCPRGAHTRDAAAQVVADDGVPALLQAQRLDHAVHPLQLHGSTQAG